MVKTKMNEANTNAIIDELHSLNLNICELIKEIQAMNKRIDRIELDNNSIRMDTNYAKNIAERSLQAIERIENKYYTVHKEELTPKYPWPEANGPCT